MPLVPGIAAPRRVPSPAGTADEAWPAVLSIDWKTHVADVSANHCPSLETNVNDYAMSTRRIQAVPRIVRKVVPAAKLRRCSSNSRVRACRQLLCAVPSEALGRRAVAASMLVGGSRASNRNAGSPTTKACAPSTTTGGRLPSPLGCRHGRPTFPTPSPIQRFRVSIRGQWARTRFPQQSWLNVLLNSLYYFCHVIRPICS